MRQVDSFWRSVLLLMMAGVCSAAPGIFAPRELFRVPFGNARETLGAQIVGGNFLFPRDFTIDGAGHFYLYDANNHRIARFSAEGKYEMDFHYLESAQQIFAHADSNQNLWLLISDPVQGVYYGVYDPHGKRMRSGIFSQYNRFRLHPGDDFTLHVILSSAQNPLSAQTYLLDEESLLMKREQVARPPENHHAVRKSDHVFFTDQIPDGSTDDAHHVTRISDEAHRGIAEIRGTVIYVSGQGEVYARVGKREIDVYDVDGTLKGKVVLTGLSSACAAIRFDAEGNLYELDGIPDQTDDQVRKAATTSGAERDFEDRHYTSKMPGMRLIKWERQ